jgi:hypothetical protein
MPTPSAQLVRRGFNVGQRECWRHHVHARKQRLTDGLHPRLGAFGTRDGQRACALRRQHGVHKQEWHPAAVVSVQMRQQDGINAVMYNALLGQGNKRRRAKINRKAPTGRIGQDTGLKPSPTPK